MKFEILVPVWGESYVDRFAQLCLRSLLAPGNLRWLCRHHAVKVTVLTASTNRDYIQDHPAFREVARLTELRFVPIDDLIDTYGRNYSSILTRAYNRAMALSPDMLGTNFIYLVGDLVFCDTALQEIAAVMGGGQDACLMCSPRVDAGALGPIFGKLGHPASLALSCRELADYLMAYPHPTLAAKIVRDSAMSLSIAHQFFWRPSADTMVARCFLLHMLCIRPTRRPPDIAAPCDFAFVTELAPGGRYHYLTDSDRFIALELQDTEHEVGFIKTHPLDVDDIAEALSAWTTPQHRAFAEATFVYRSRGSDYTVEQGRALTDPFVRALKERLPAPMDHRHHIFWLGAVGAHRISTRDLPAVDADTARSIPPSLRRLLDDDRRRRNGDPIDLAVLVDRDPGPLATLIGQRARAMIRAEAPRIYEVVEDVAGAGGSLLVVLEGNLADFLDLYLKPHLVSRLYSVAGPGRTLLLAYSVDPEALRDGRPSRRHLSDLYAAAFGAQARFGLVSRVVDLSSSPLDGLTGFIIEVSNDESIDGAAALAREGRGSLLYGLRER